MAGPGSRLWLLVPGDLDTPTGGYAYDRHMLAGLSGLGWGMEYRALDPGFPDTSPRAMEETAAIVSTIPDGSPVVVDGLAFAVLPELVRRESGRLDLIALIHHPLALEHGLSPLVAATLREQETRALAEARLVLVTSPATAHLLAGYRVPEARIRVVLPGTDPAPAALGSDGGPLRLICVASLTPRKGHDLLLHALAPLTHLDWRLDCVGSLDRDPDWAAEIHRLNHGLGLADRVHFTGVLDQPALDTLYHRSDLFVLPTRFEGYGMVFAEALARGLPIVTNRAGAVPQTVPEEAALMVEPGEVTGLTEALARVISDPELRTRLARASRECGLRLPTWSDSVGRFAAAIESRHDG